jgi:hypothetical protein
MNIIYDIEEVNKFDDSIVDLNKLIYEFENAKTNNEMDIYHIINYNENYTIKELLLICDYYGILKELKQNKCNKQQIITSLVNFELDPLNTEIVFRRKNMWFYINELKNDKFMKKFILWK